MSRIGESSEDQRIREMQEADYRQKVDREKRLDQERVTKSFQEVMTQRSARESARRTAAHAQSEADASQAQQKKSDNRLAGDKQKPVVLGNPKQRELQQRAAMATAAQGQQAKARKELSENATALERDRNVDLNRRADDDADALRADVDRDVAREQRLEEKHALEHAQPVAVDADEQSRTDRDRRQQGGGERDDQAPQAAGVAAQKADGPRAANPTKLPVEILEHIAKSVAVAAAADGKLSLSISLKGTMLDGVTVHVTANKGKVRCVFEGCDKQLGNLIESSKGELMRQLGKRGFELDILRVK